MKVLSFIVFSFFAFFAAAEYRVALVIDNSAYKKHALPNEETKKLISTLKKSGFKVDVWENISTKDIDRKVENYAWMTPVNSTLLIYYSGYAAAGDYKGKIQNFLLSPQSEYKNEADLLRRSTALHKITEALVKTSSSRNKIIALDLKRYPEFMSEKAHTFTQPAVKDDIIYFANVKPESGSIEGTSLTAELLKHGTISSSLTAVLESSSSWNFNLDAARPTSSPNDFPAKELTVGAKAGDEWINDAGMVFCWCPPGKYIMGSPSSMPGHEADQIQKEVTIKQGFWMSKYEFTNLHYKKIRGRDSDKFKVNKANHPAILNFDDKKNMIKALAQKAPIPKGWEYDYPTEEEWEYAARAGSQDKFFWGSDESKLPEYANFADKSLYDLKDGFYNYSDRKLVDGTPLIAEVGSYKANPWGLHDMYGNVWEWCKTIYTKDRSLPTKKNKGKGNVAKGGSWCSKKDYCHSAFRHHFEGRYDNNFIGLRLIIRQK